MASQYLFARPTFGNLNGHPYFLTINWPKMEYSTDLTLTLHFKKKKNSQSGKSVSDSGVLY